MKKLDALERAVLVIFVVATLTYIGIDVVRAAVSRVYCLGYCQATEKQLEYGYLNSNRRIVCWCR